ncbi:MAG: FGGY family carbohydrate kinase [Chloroflexi bacterium]|nr:FGGY family carbohydrate kinase [Chloroflexota bacterium]
MPERVYVGLDIGSSGIRAVAVGPGGQQVGEARRRRVRRPMSLMDFERDLDLDGIWRACLDVLTEVGAGQHVAAIGVAACRHSLIVTDAQDEVLFASGNDDVRASLAGASVESESDCPVLAVTGHTPAMIHWPGKLRWLTEDRPDVCDAAARVTTLDAWVAGRLGSGDTLTTVSAVETGAWDLAADGWAMDLLPKWAQSVLPAVEIDPEPTQMSPRAGFASDCVIAAGWPDSHAAEFATRGTSSEGDCVAAGWSTTILRPVDAHSSDAEVWRGQRMGGGLVAEANAGDGGTGYGWLRAQNPSGELTMDALADEPAADAGVFVLSGLRVMDWRAPGLSVAGMLSPAPFVIGMPTASMLGAAVLEDLAFAIHGNRLALNSVQPAVGPIRLTGGYAEAPAVGQILANVTGSQVCSFPRLGASAWGAALAGAADDFGGMPGAAEVLAPDGVWCEPDVNSVAAFADHFQRWLDLRERLESFVQDAL